MAITGIETAAKLFENPDNIGYDGNERFLTTGTTGAYNLILFLLPYRSTMPEFDKYISYQLGGLVLDMLTVRAVLYAFPAVIMLPLARSGFRKHQVS